MARLLALCGMTILSGIGWLQTTQSLHADEPSLAAGEYNLKLARLYATSKFITWPDERQGGNAPFVIAIIAPDPFAGGLEKLAERKIKDRPIVTKVIYSADDLPNCHLLFIPAKADAVLVKQVLDKLRDKPVLVWLDQRESYETVNAACTFVKQDDKIVIDTDQSELQRLGLLPDGRLLSLNLVRIVKTTK